MGGISPSPFPTCSLSLSHRFSSLSFPLAFPPCLALVCMSVLFYIPLSRNLSLFLFPPVPLFLRVFACLYRRSVRDFVHDYPSTFPCSCHLPAYVCVPVPSCCPRPRVFLPSCYSRICACACLWVFGCLHRRTARAFVNVVLCSRARTVVLPALSCLPLAAYIPVLAPPLPSGTYGRPRFGIERQARQRAQSSTAARTSWTSVLVVAGKVGRGVRHLRRRYLGEGRDTLF